MTERLMVVNINSVRGDHLERYEYTQRICSGDVLDAACGCGYGSFIIAQRSTVNNIDAVDISKEAIDLAKDAWSNPKINHIQQSIIDFEFKKQYDWLVSFETIEHVPDIELFLTKSSNYCKNIICSVPNESVIPFDKNLFPYHLRHYKSQEIKQLLEDCGFSINTVKYQKNKEKNGLNFNSGRSIILEGISKNI